MSYRVPGFMAGNGNFFQTSRAQEQPVTNVPRTVSFDGYTTFKMRLILEPASSHDDERESCLNPSLIISRFSERRLLAQVQRRIAVKGQSYETKS
jgi:hypothetical protein